MEINTELQYPGKEKRQSTRRLVCVEICSEGERFLLPVAYIEAVIADPVVVQVPEGGYQILGISLYEEKTVVYYHLSDQMNGYKDRIKCGIIIKTKRCYKGVAAEEVSEELTISASEWQKQITENLKNLLEG